MTIRFQEGKSYYCCGLYGDGTTIIPVTITRTIDDYGMVFYYADDKDRELHTGKIEIVRHEYFDNNFKVTADAFVERVLCWEYHSPYAADPDDIDRAYYCADSFDGHNTAEYVKQLFKPLVIW